MASKNPYTDRQLVDEKSHKSLTLCRTVLKSPQTPQATRVSCLARFVALLDALPSVRALDRQLRSNATSHISTSECRLLLDRSIAYRDLAQAFHRLGDSCNSTYNYQRATTLLQTLFSSISAQEESEICADRREMADTTQKALMEALCDWAEIERTMGRNTIAKRIQDRAARLTKSLANS
ncbi:hypothetical protein H4R22_000053 [Coemansia sp. RSA 1290]|nr:hypothetical protein LPJ68_000051 [Coemansia sp. RSA 1086]KAJ1753602.1 hypothetical protein LPJ79_000195 [Coemansia sp. RSA 1821]KAJ2633965.1 hypothetical protein H4R22_000053 [Coemansia sp. RSA 1290]KAJ2652302.1 hypothetical protein IWW40_001157 [Coemansia sp. RSA 1250]KAJ2675829.1 hypothetical protein IWW42_000874 [Coemansia sp. RSA 1085]